MKDFVIKDLSSFITVASGFDTELKFFEVQEDKLRAEIYLRTVLVSWEGKYSTEGKMKLVDAGFAEAELRETKRFEELM